MTPVPQALTRTRAHTLSQILELNPSTDLAYLGSFSDDELDHYLDHLLHSQHPRAEARPWVRKGNSRAISSRESDI